jgi:hypothetical protein
MKKLTYLIVAIAALLDVNMAFTQLWYYGELHGHTQMSDGKGTVGHYFRYARDTSSLNFAAITDHDCSIWPSFYPARWDTIRETTNVYDSSNFVALIGYEWSAEAGNTSNGFRYGHFCVYYPSSNPGLYACNNPYYTTPSLLYTAIASQGGIVHAAHPDLWLSGVKKSTE